MIELKNISAGYAEKNILQIPSLCFEDGKITSIIGLNGSGKTTLLKTILGLVHSKGDIFIDGKNARSISVKERAKKIAYLPQNPQKADMTVLTLCEHGRFPYLGFSKILNESDKNLVQNALRLTDMWEKRDKLLKEISGGELQRAYLAMIISQDTKTILLDEPASFMDVKHQLAVLRVLKKLANDGRGIIMVSHDIPQSFTFSDKICVLREGKVLSYDEPEKIANDANILKNAMGFNIRKTESEDLFYKYELVN